jgi:hypothetical protein
MPDKPQDQSKSVPFKDGMRPADTKPSGSFLEDLMAAVSHSPIGSIIAGKYSGMLPADKPYLHQYLNPDEDSIPKQTLRPANAPNMAKMDGEWRRTLLPDHFKGKLDGKSVYDVTQLTKPEKVAFTVLGADNDKDVIDTMHGLQGLGNTQAYIGNDAQGPYLSMLDRWDFDSPSVKPVIGKLMDTLLGKPYNIYDRFDMKDTDSPKGDFPYYVQEFNRRK